MQYLKGIASLKIDDDRCSGCGVCIEVCPHKVITLKDRKAIVKTLDACMECGACRMNCPTGAIDVQAGVGCASAIFRGMFTGKEPSCGCECDEGISDCC